ncbi:unnamed protein product [Lactuca saligna]|uniref:Pentacotripeptide-repeat region of PRORP domain-containing protein n=1 Tax=Lactuca saligna TaxID=75948 RepID=A0AA35V4C2_LACSI|nr:unnamed protein product [Lactuca saligna]
MSILQIMLKRSKFSSTYVLQILKSLNKTQIYPFSTSNGNGSCSESETDWARLLKPFDIEQLRESLHRITPLQLQKLLHLPLDVSTSLEIFNSASTQKGYAHTFDVYYALIDKIGAVGEFKTIDRLLMQMKDEGIVFQETLFVMIMRHYQRADLPGQARRLLLVKMRDVFLCQPTSKSYNAVLDILVQGGCFKDAPKLFDEMLERGIPPDVFSFAIVMKAHCSINEVDSACTLLRRMTKYGCAPNSKVYQTLIHALSKDNRVDKALTLLEEMIVMGCTPDLETFNDAIHALCRSNRIHEAAKLMDRMLLRGFTPNALTYGVLIHGLCRNKQVEEAKTLITRVHEPNSIMYNMLVNGFIAKGQFDEAKAIVSEKMSINGCHPDIHTYTSLIHGLCKTGHLVSAHDLMKEMESKGYEPNTITYTILIDGFCKNQRFDEASEVIQEMSQKGLSLNTIGYNSIIHSLCKYGDVYKAVNLFEEMRMNGCKRDIFTFNSLIFGLCEIEMIQHALRMCRKDMVLEGVVADTVTYNTLIRSFLKQEMELLKKHSMFLGR